MDEIKLKKSVDECRSGLKSKFMALGGRNFGSYQAKSIDKFFKDALKIAVNRAFGEFMPSDLPICVIAVGSWALNEMSYKGKIGFILIFKELSGYANKAFCAQFMAILERAGLDIDGEICELDEIKARFKNNCGAKDGGAIQRRFVCGSKQLYINAKERFNELIAQNKEQIIAENIQKILAPILPTTINGPDGDFSARECAINTKQIFYKYRRICTLLGLIGAKKRAMNSDEWAQFVLAGDFISSARSSVQIVGGADILSAEFARPVAQILALKNRRGLVAMQKSAAAALSVDLWARYLACALFSKRSKAKLSELKRARFRGGIYIINSVATLGVNAKPVALNSALKIILDLPDQNISFSAPAIIWLKRSLKIHKSGDGAELIELLIQILRKNHSAGVLKALLDSEILYLILKPAAKMRHLASGGILAADEKAIAMITLLEQYIARKDGLINGLNSDEICALKLAILMSEAYESALKSGNIFRAFGRKTSLNSELIINASIAIKHQGALLNMEQNAGALMASKIANGSALKLLAVFEALSALNSPFEINKIITAKNAILSSPLNGTKASFKRAAKERLIKKTKDFLALSNDQQNELLSIRSNLLFERYNASQIIEIYSRAKEARGIALSVQDGELLSIKIISAKKWNLSGLLARLSDLSLQYMEICELFDGLVYLKMDLKKIKNVDLGGLNARIIAGLCIKELPNQTPINAKINIKQIDSKYSEIKVSAKDQIGLMSSILSAFKRAGLEVISARAQTIKSHARDLFLVRNGDGLSEKIKAFESELNGR